MSLSFPKSMRRFMEEGNHKLQVVDNGELRENWREENHL